MVEVGKKYKTVGGWEALVIHISKQISGFYAIHAPGTENESAPIIHEHTGMAVPVFVIGNPPRYGKLLPSDILINEEIK